MNSNKQKNKRQVSKAPAAKPQVKDNGVWLISFSLLLVLIAYLPVFKAGFVNWDDDDYVGTNTAIRSFSNFHELVTKSVQGNYHPITMLSLAFNYAWTGLKPWSYHLLNLILHLLNVILVYRLASRLSGNNNIISFTTALLFGVHPMHVESVAWVAERKDVLYTFFFLLGLITYLRYVNKNSVPLYLLTLFWFLLSLASKPAAIIFPAVLFVMDFFQKRKFTLKIIAEKIPFFFFAAILAYLTFHAQKTGGATDNFEMFALGRRIFFGFYGYMMYFFKMFVPVNLVTFYPIPPNTAALPALYLVSPFFFIATLVLCLVTWRKYPVIAFGFGFYFINLLLVLQFIVVGSAVMAERYTYVPYIGLFFLAGWLLDKKFRQKPFTAYSILISIGILFTAVSYSQAGVWKNGAALWDHQIEKLPCAKAYVIRGGALDKEGNSDKALLYYNEAIKINAAEHEAYTNRGNIYFQRGQDDLALADYNKALSLRPDYVVALTNRGSLYSRQKNYAEGLKNLSRALELNPEYPSALLNRGTNYLFTGQYENAIRDFEKYLRLRPDETDIYNTIGECYQYMNKHTLSIEPFNVAIRQDPRPVYFLNRSKSYHAMGKDDEARKDAIQAREMGVQIDPAYAKSIGL